MVSRADEVLALIDPRSSKGLEIGPLDRPIVSRHDGEIYYVDHATTEELREKYANHANVSKERLAEIDYVAGAVSLSEAVGSDGPFDYIIASHVIEHVPDLIGWLGEVSDILRPGGLLSLVIPDRRYTFDVLRRTSTLAEAVEAYLVSRRNPSIRQVFDHYSRVVNFDIPSAAELWAHPEKLIRKFTDDKAYAMAREAESTQTYIDVHAWVFTPASFFGLYGDLARLGFVDFEVARFAPRAELGNEFYVTLRTIADNEAGTLPAAQIDSIPPGFPTSTFPLEGSYVDLPEARDEELIALRNRSRHLQDRINRLTGSRSWRLTAPFRWALSHAKRLTGRQ